MTLATKAEAQAVLNWARTKAQNAHTAMLNVENPTQWEIEAAQMHYQRCVRELEEAINEYAKFDVTGDDE